MQRASRCRGGGCLEFAVLLGIIGAVMVLVAGVLVRKLDRIETSSAGYSGEICR